jgi:hypothetical protein
MGASVREHIELRGDRLSDDRLLGYRPTIVIWWKQIALIAEGPQNSVAARAAFEVDPSLLGELQPEDQLHMVRTSSADLAVSVLRRGELIVAFGALTAVSLGPKVSVESTLTDVEISTLTETQRLRPGNSATVGGYVASVLRCCEAGLAGRDECVALATASASSTETAYRCALLLAGGGDPLTITDPEQSAR